MSKYEAENRRPLVGAVVTADSVKRVVLEDGGSAALRDQAVPHVLRCIAGKL
jgi:hypothetical protein